MRTIPVVDSKGNLVNVMTRTENEYNAIFNSISYRVPIELVLASQLVQPDHEPLDPGGVKYKEYLVIRVASMSEPFLILQDLS